MSIFVSNCQHCHEQQSQMYTLHDFFRSKVRFIHMSTVYIGSGLVLRERMETAFPHKKLRGNGIHTREILRDIINYYCY